MRCHLSTPCAKDPVQWQRLWQLQVCACSATAECCPSGIAVLQTALLPEHLLPPLTAAYESKQQLFLPRDSILHVGECAH